MKLHLASQIQFETQGWGEGGRGGRPAEFRLGSKLDTLVERRNELITTLRFNSNWRTPSFGYLSRTSKPVSSEYK